MSTDITGTYAGRQRKKKVLSEELILHLPMVHCCCFIPSLPFCILKCGYSTQLFTLGHSTFQQSSNKRFSDGSKTAPYLEMSQATKLQGRLQTLKESSWASWSGSIHEWDLLLSHCWCLIDPWEKSCQPDIVLRRHISPKCEDLSLGLLSQRQSAEELCPRWCQGKTFVTFSLHGLLIWQGTS